MKRKIIWAIEIIIGALCVPFGIWCVNVGDCIFEPILATVGAILLVILGGGLFQAERYSYLKEKSNDKSQK